MNNPIVRFITWLWDAGGEQRTRQEERISSTESVVRHNATARARALDEVRRTQRHISDHLGN